MISVVYDIECLANLFTFTGFVRQTKEYKQFVIHSSKNEYQELIVWLFSEKMIMIGYNNCNYDYPIIHHLINHFEEYKYLTGNELTQRIYQKSQEIISMEFSSVAEWNEKIKQIDLMRIHHFDGAAKTTSLKQLEIAMNLDNVEDMPYHHTYWVTKQSEIDEILAYNKWDVYSTTCFLDVTLGNTNHPVYKGKNKIELRQSIIKKYGLKCYNWNDVKLGVELILHLYCKKFNKNPQTIRKLRTHRDVINLSDCIPKWCDLSTPEMKRLVNFFNKAVIYNGVTKGVVNFDLIFHNIKIYYGSGGAHASIKPGVYEKNDEMMILDLDIDGMYPNLAITQGIYPEHLGKEFIDIYDGEIVSVRTKEKKKPKKERDFVIVEGLKLASNGTYGKSNSNDSYLYDPLYTMKTTISGQILISMWAEKLVKVSPTLTILQINTRSLVF